MPNSQKGHRRTPTRSRAAGDGVLAPTRARAPHPGASPPSCCRLPPASLLTAAVAVAPPRGGSAAEESAATAANRRLALGRAARRRAGRSRHSPPPGWTLWAGVSDALSRRRAAARQHRAGPTVGNMVPSDETKTAPDKPERHRLVRLSFECLSCERTPGVPRFSSSKVAIRPQRSVRGVLVQDSARASVVVPSEAGETPVKPIAVWANQTQKSASVKPGLSTFWRNNNKDSRPGRASDTPQRAVLASADSSMPVILPWSTLTHSGCRAAE